VLTNTGGLDKRGAAEPLATGLLRRLLGLPDQAIRTHIPPHPETWRQLCGRCGPSPCESPSERLTLVDAGTGW